MKQCLILMKFNLLIFITDPAFDIRSEKFSLSPKTLRFSSKMCICIVLYFAFKCMIYFEIIFVLGKSLGRGPILFGLWIVKQSIIIG
jgi:hypothetical protein